MLRQGRDDMGSMADIDSASEYSYDECSQGDRDLALDDCTEKELAGSIASADRVADARTLATMGFGPRVIAQLTGWSERFARDLSDRVGRKNRGGKPRSELAEIIRIPMCHTAASRFVMAVEQQLAFWGDRHLSSRVLVRAIQYTQMTMPDAMRMIPPTAFYSIAMGVVNKSVKTICCKQCRGSYAQFSLQSGLTGQTVFDCPVCRLVNLMLPSRKRSIESCVPSSLAELKLRGPFGRMLAKGAEHSDIQAVMALALYGPVSRKVN